MTVKIVPMPVAEVCDRFTIALLKQERLDDSQIDKAGLARQITHYRQGIDTSIKGLTGLVNRLKDINSDIWFAEAAIRAGQDEQLGLEEIGRRAIKIRDLNRIRIKIKNDITNLVNQPDFADCKVNHASS